MVRAVVHIATGNGYLKIDGAMARKSPRPKLTQYTTQKFDRPDYFFSFTAIIRGTVRVYRDGRLGIDQIEPYENNDFVGP